MSIKWSDELEIQASHRAKELQEAQARVKEVVAQVEVICKQLELLKSQCAKFEACVVTAEERATKTGEEASLLKQELTKRLEMSAHKAIVDFLKSEEFEIKVALWSRDASVAGVKDLSKDIHNVDTQFPLKEFLAYQAIEAEVQKAAEYDSWDDSESPEPSNLRRSKRTPVAESALAEVNSS